MRPNHHYFIDSVSPNGLMFVKHHVRKSLLSKMLSEFLDTRVMIKQSMKLTKDDKASHMWISILTACPSNY